MISWTTAFLDFGAPTFGAGVAFWQDATGYGLSPFRGEHDEFATLVPPQGDAFLRVQRLGTGPDGVHLDLHSPDVDRLEVRQSPGGLTHCLVPAHESVRPEPADWGTHVSLVDQVCLDIPAGVFDEECRYWSELTGWDLVQSSVRKEFWALQRPADIPLRFLLQRLDSFQDVTTAHFDIACTDVRREVARHQALGATVVVELQWWTSMLTPTGSPYCITSRDPRTGLLP